MNSRLGKKKKKKDGCWMNSRLGKKKRWVLDEQQIRKKKKKKMGVG